MSYSENERTNHNSWGKTVHFMFYAVYSFNREKLKVKKNSTIFLYNVFYLENWEINERVLHMYPVEPSMVVHACDPSTWGSLEERECSKFKARIGYIMNLRPA